ncbi:ECF-type riboflavin transporter substrate-binding protein [Weissella minor]|uniref:ECF-type riboflavin transporter substrate-binding protein n=1 Tax=Weissella minor TaxID=1620 RepID=UPI00070E8F86|nr:ECF-type riboflavin transporter substrate-binding protein [Weissella minor]
MKAFVKMGFWIVIWSLIGFCAYQYVSVGISVPNSLLSLEPAVLAVASFFLGPIGTMGTGFLSHFLYDSLNYSIVWWTWILAEGIAGLMLGLVSRRLELLRRPFDLKRCLQFNMWQTLVNFLAWGVIAPLGDYLIYKSNWTFVFEQGLTIAAVNTIVIAIVGSLFLFLYNYFYNS